MLKFRHSVLNRRTRKRKAMLWNVTTAGAMLCYTYIPLQTVLLALCETCRLQVTVVCAGTASQCCRDACWEHPSWHTWLVCRRCSVLLEFSGVWLLLRALAVGWTWIWDQCVWLVLILQSLLPCSFLRTNLFQPQCWSFCCRESPVGNSWGIMLLLLLFQWRRTRFLRLKAPLLLAFCFRNALLFPGLESQILLWIFVWSDSLPSRCLCLPLCLEACCRLAVAPLGWCKTCNALFLWDT